MRLFYKNQPAKLKREYFFGDKMKAEIEVGDKVLYVDRVELTEEISSESTTDTLTIDDIINDKVELSNLEVLESDVDVSEIILEEDKTTILQSEKEVKATKLTTNKSINIGSVDSDKFTTFLKRNKLSKDAVLAVLEGKQKTHKGFSFSNI